MPSGFHHSSLPDSMKSFDFGVAVALWVSALLELPAPLQLPAAYFFVVLIALFHREMRSRTQPATPEPRTHRRGSPAWTPREVATPGCGLRCRQLRTLAALAVANGRCLLTELSYRPSRPWVLIGNGEQSGLHRSPGYIVNQEQSPKSCGLNDPNVPLAGSPATLSLYFPYLRW